MVLPQVRPNSSYSLPTDSESTARRTRCRHRPRNCATTDRGSRRCRGRRAAGPRRPRVSSHTPPCSPSASVRPPQVAPNVSASDRIRTRNTTRRRRRSHRTHSRRAAGRFLGQICRRSLRCDLRTSRRSSRPRNRAPTTATTRRSRQSRRRYSRHGGAPVCRNLRFLLGCPLLTGPTFNRFFDKVAARERVFLVATAPEQLVARRTAVFPAAHREIRDPFALLRAALRVRSFRRPAPRRGGSTTSASADDARTLRWSSPRRASIASPVVRGRCAVARPDRPRGSPGQPAPSRTRVAGPTPRLRPGAGRSSGAPRAGPAAPTAAPRAGACSEPVLTPCGVARADGLDEPVVRRARTTRCRGAAPRGSGARSRARATTAGPARPGPLEHLRAEPLLGDQASSNQCTDLSFVRRRCVRPTARTASA